MPLMIVLVSSMAFFMVFGAPAKEVFSNAMLDFIFMSWYRNSEGLSGLRVTRTRLDK
jgi:hypothetical protein